MKKIITAALSFVAVFALITGVTINNSAQASVLGSRVVSSTWTHVGQAGTTDNITDKLNVGSKGNRFVHVTVQNISNTHFSFVTRILTGAGSFDDYADCNGNEVSLYISACKYNINSGETFKFTTHLDDSSWWKDRDGLYLETYDDIDNKSLSYTLETL
jgi:hypothetical protein